MTMPPDVVVIGGGPGGAVTASALRRRGLAVAVYERVSFPRFHLGESLLPETLPVLEQIGALAAVREAFLPKYGARFHDDLGARYERFSFDGAWKPGYGHAFQVSRDTFDTILLDHARSLGVDVHERTAVARITKDDSGRATGVELEGGARVPARFVVDATGRDAMTAQAERSRRPIDGLDQTALYTHYEGVPRQAGQLEGDIDVVLFPSGDPTRANWFWIIPFKDGRTSVGAVVSRAWIREAKGASAAADAGVETTTALFDEAVRASPSATKLLAGATRLWPKAEAAADFSYRVGVRRGPGWLAVGDAGGFVDPLFSTGVHLAVSGGFLAADAIVRALAEPEREAELVGAWASLVERATETFILAVSAFYKGPLVDHLFAPDKHAALRRSITSLLAGDVFGDAVWLRDVRLRLRQMLAQASF
jgi:flavin-dependent dehydrogenase